MNKVSEQIKQNIVNHLCWDGRVDASDIKVEVSGDSVDLSGTVPTSAARKAAVDDTLVVAGVNSVKNNIAVSYPSQRHIPSDEQIKMNIENRLKWDPEIDSSKIKITVNQGFVTVEGDVDCIWKKEKVEELVSDLLGVNGVVNMLVIVPSEQTADKKIAQEIVASLDRMRHVNPAKIDIRVNKGQVVFSGNVPDWAGYDAAYDAARFTRGVTQIVNNLKVK